MEEKVRTKSELIGDGTMLLAIDREPLLAGESRDIGPIDTSSCSAIGGDIIADQACTLLVIPLPSEGVEGAPSDVQTVAAGVPERWTYSLLFAPQVLLRVANIGAAAMESFVVTVRGDA